MIPSIVSDGMLPQQPNHHLLKSLFSSLVRGTPKTFRHSLQACALACAKAKVKRTVLTFFRAGQDMAQTQHICANL